MQRRLGDGGSAFGGNVASVTVKMSSQLIFLKTKCYERCTFSATCKDNVVINCVSLQHKISVTFDESHDASPKLVKVFQNLKENFSRTVQGSEWAAVGPEIHTSDKYSQFLNLSGFKIWGGKTFQEMSHER
jgi:hypothetical protein